MYREYSYDREAAARDARRGFISRGYVVSLIAFDPSRGLYAFDVLEA